MPWLCCKGSKPKIKDDVTFIVVGLDNAGKSTLVSALQNKLDANIVPTIGFNEPVRLVRNKVHVRLFDLGGGPRIRGVWDQYFAEVHGIIYVVDSAADNQMQESAEVFTGLLKKDSVHGKPILVFANKQDLPGAHDEADISVKLNIAELRTRHSVVKCVANPQKNGGAVDDRVFQGLDWLVNAVQVDLATLSARVARDTAAAQAEREARRAAQKIKQAEYRKEKEARLAREKAGEAASESKGAAAAAPASDVIVCTVCKFRPATGRAAVSKWLAICDECKAALEAGKPPPIPADAPAAAPAPAPAPEPAPSSDGPKCAVCNLNPAVRKSGKLGWKPVCDGCDPDVVVAAAAASASTAAAAAGGAAADAGNAGAATAEAVAADAAQAAGEAGAGVAASATAAGEAADSAAGAAHDAAAMAAAQVADVGAAAKPHLSAMSDGDAATPADAQAGATGHGTVTLPGGLNATMSPAPRVDDGQSGFV